MTVRTPWDPFARGALPAGVRTVFWHDAARDRTLPVEIYYPALPSKQRTEGGTEATVRDAPAATGSHPLVLFIHGWYGNRGECSILCAHLASHGYRVASADFVGSTAADVSAHLGQADYDFESSWESIARDRLQDLPFLIDAATQEFGEPITAAGVTGTSLGGWCALMAPAVDARVRAIVPLCPVGGPGPLEFNGVPFLSRFLTQGWRSAAEVTTLVADRDSWLPLYGQIDLFARIKSPAKRLVVLRRADHLHFIDAVRESHDTFAAFTLNLAGVAGAKNVPWSAIAGQIRPAAELMPEAEARTIVCGLTILQMDAALKRSSAARIALDDVNTELRRRGLDAYAISTT